jgi:hypothetical protein
MTISPTSHTRRGPVGPLTAVATLLVLAVAAADAEAQTVRNERVPDRTEQVRLSGPRFGVTLLTPAMQESLEDKGIEVGAVITQFGWQFERQFLGQKDGLAAVNEWIVLVGGLDQGTFLPSVSWIVGLRGRRGRPNERRRADQLPRRVHAEQVTRRFPSQRRRAVWGRRRRCGAPAAYPAIPASRA